MTRIQVNSSLLWKLLVLIWDMKYDWSSGFTKFQKTKKSLYLVFSLYLHLGSFLLGAKNNLHLPNLYYLKKWPIRYLNRFHLLLLKGSGHIWKDNNNLVYYQINSLKTIYHVLRMLGENPTISHPFCFFLLIFFHFEMFY